ncbi:uncharacterized protein MYCFIDRAFT_177624 [Pseudocercospora fijiensis CIRAD86]|uniref:Uncharacterized protein n=1 Tax=Pseudocercospora fijiensis (strain CIRAD86) TaxID=383855 RepID=M2ZNL8_PSEFD|nr:uncharacterized protein MYCFIDRAFT_177624 [Pseudocercospora fijiensis CIRAD86]EME80689.1 hypothetical protein MYCFIDRAFT_177624 [Pseudocercospora fijiensis CIRAD86]
MRAAPNENIAMSSSYPVVFWAASGQAVTSPGWYRMEAFFCIDRHVRRVYNLDSMTDFKRLHRATREDAILGKRQTCDCERNNAGPDIEAVRERWQLGVSWILSDLFEMDSHAKAKVGGCKATKGASQLHLSEASAFSARSGRVSNGASTFLPVSEFGKTSFLQEKFAAQHRLEQSSLCPLRPSPQLSQEATNSMTTPQPPTTTTATANDNNMASNTTSGSTITAKRIAKDISTGRPACIQLHCAGREKHIYNIPSPLHVYVAIFYGSRNAATAIVQSGTITQPSKAFNSDAALKFFTSAASDSSISRSAQLSKPLSEVHLVLDLRHSPYAPNIYAHNGKTMAAFSQSKIPEWEYKFSRSLEVAVPFLIQDQSDLTNYRYGCVVLIVGKHDHEEKWRVETFRPEIQVEAHTPDAALDTVCSVLLQRMEKQPVEALTAGDLLPETLGKLQVAIMAIDIGCEGTKWEAVAIKEAMSARKAHLARLPKVRANVKHSGVDMMEYLQKKKGNGVPKDERSGWWRFVRQRGSLRKRRLLEFGLGESVSPRIVRAAQSREEQHRMDERESTASRTQAARRDVEEAKLKSPISLWIYSPP